MKHCKLFIFIITVMKETCMIILCHCTYVIIRGTGLYKDVNCYTLSCVLQLSEFLWAWMNLCNIQLYLYLRK